MTLTFNVEKSFPWQGVMTDKVNSVMKMFGIDKDRLFNDQLKHTCSFSIEAGQICFLTGASGSGKSVLLREFFEAAPEEERVWLDDVELSGEASLVDCIDGDYVSSLRYLSKAGLNDVFTVLNTPACLSEGQKYRYRLAKAIQSGKRYIFADEFCTNLDRITASVIAFNMRKFADRQNVCFFLASSHDDIISDLRPDVLIVKHLCGESEVVYEGKAAIQQ